MSEDLKSTLQMTGEMHITQKLPSAYTCNVYVCAHTHVYVHTHACANTHVCTHTQKHTNTDSEKHIMTT